MHLVSMHLLDIRVTSDLLHRRKDMQASSHQTLLLACTCICQNKQVCDVTQAAVVTDR